MNTIVVTGSEAEMAAAMLNEWSDRPPPRPPRPFYRRGEFWVALLTVFVCAGLLLGLLSRFLG